MNEFVFAPSYRDLSRGCQRGSDACQTVGGIRQCQDTMVEICPRSITDGKLWMKMDALKEKQKKKKKSCHTELLEMFIEVLFCFVS